jgi:uncharacterized protein YdcH (DUF465 family)
MYVEHHDLHHEFPQFGNAIHALKTSNQHFLRLFDEYHELTTKVEQLAINGIPVDDLTYEDLKKKRLKLKDELHGMLIAHGA